MGVDHQFVVRDDGTISALYPSDLVRRRPVRYRRSKDGRVVPVDRGKRRARVIEETGPFLDAVGPQHPEYPGSFPGITSEDKRGPVGADVATIFERVEALRSDGYTVDAACQQVSDETYWSYSVVRRHYYSERKRRRGGV
jgi:hypothetical protein